MDTNDSAPAACYNAHGGWKTLMELGLEAEHHRRQYKLGATDEDHEARLVDCERAYDWIYDKILDDTLPLDLAEGEWDPKEIQALREAETKVEYDSNTDEEGYVFGIFDGFVLLYELRNWGHLRAGSRRRSKPGHLRIKVRRSQIDWGLLLPR